MTQQLKALAALWEDLSSQYPHGSLQPFVTPVPGDVITFWLPQQKEQFIDSLCSQYKNASLVLGGKNSCAFILIRAHELIGPGESNWQ